MLTSKTLLALTFVGASAVSAFGADYTILKAQTSGPGGGTIGFTPVISGDNYTSVVDRVAPANFPDTLTFNFNVKTTGGSYVHGFVFDYYFTPTTVLSTSNFTLRGVGLGADGGAAALTPITFTLAGASTSTVVLGGVTYTKYSKYIDVSSLKYASWEVGSDLKWKNGTFHGNGGGVVTTPAPASALSLWAVAGLRTLVRRRKKA